jgi:sugar lactone lactonase YvrE
MFSNLKTVSSAFFKSQLIAVLVAGVTLAACGNPAEDLLRIRADEERNRLWLLDGNAVSLYHNRSGKLVQRIVLPHWTFVGKQYACPPDLTVDAAGAVFVTSNVLPVLWRIDPERFEVTLLELKLDADQDKDVGFTGLAFAEDGTLLAASAVHGSLWRIDVGASTAEKLASSTPVRGVCEPAALLARMGY